MTDDAPRVSPMADAGGTPGGRAGTSPSSWGVPALAALAFLLFWQIAPRVRVDGVAMVLASTVVSLALVIWLTAHLALALRTVRSLVLSVLVSGGLVVPLLTMFALRRPVAPWVYLVFVPGLPHLLTIWFAASIGAALSRLVRAANMIPPVAAVLALVDIWTVLLGGPVQQAMRSQTPAAQAVVRSLTVPLPAPESRGPNAAPMMVVGFADFLFIAFFMAALHRFLGGLPAFRRTIWVLIVVLCAYMLVVFFTGWSLPALVPMAIVLIGMHWSAFHYERSEAFALLYAGFFIVAIAAGFWLFAGSRPEPAGEPIGPSPRARPEPATGG